MQQKDGDCERPRAMLRDRFKEMSVPLSVWELQLFPDDKGELADIFPLLISSN